MHPFQKSKPESLLDPPLILLWRVLKAWDKLDLFFSLMIINKLSYSKLMKCFSKFQQYPQLSIAIEHIHILLLSKI